MPEEQWSKNPNLVAGRKIPNGKTFRDFFDCNKDLLRPNTLGWPRGKSHNPITRTKKHLCLKHQCVDSCSSSCGVSHVDPEKLNEEARKSIDDETNPCLKLPNSCRTAIKGAGSERGQTKRSGTLQQK